MDRESIKIDIVRQFAYIVTKMLNFGIRKKELILCKQSRREIDKAQSNATFSVKKKILFTTEVLIV